MTVVVSILKNFTAPKQLSLVKNIKYTEIN